MAVNYPPINNYFAGEIYNSNNWTTVKPVNTIGPTIFTSLTAVTILTTSFIQVGITSASLVAGQRYLFQWQAEPNGSSATWMRLQLYDGAGVIIPNTQVSNLCTASGEQNNSFSGIITLANSGQVSLKAISFTNNNSLVAGNGSWLSYSRIF